MHRSDADGRPRGRCGAARHVGRFTQQAKAAPEEADRHRDRKKGEADIESDRHRSAIRQHRDKVRRPDTNSLGHRGDDEPVTPAGIDTVSGPAEDDEEADIPEDADQCGNQDKSQIVLIDDAFKDAEHACSPRSPALFCH